MQQQADAHVVIPYRRENTIAHRCMISHVHPDTVLIVVVGDAVDILSKGRVVLQQIVLGGCRYGIRNRYCCRLA